MRLLKCIQPATATSRATFSLEEFAASKIPLVYAILSHRWTEDEVTFEDLRDKTGTAKEGYRKLEFCAKQAAAHGILYFWVDTCCIKKESSSELSEAITSMFRWYNNATVCYVYMPDVSLPGDEKSESTQSQWIPDFQKSEWFRRGWTLQELIAPSCVKFFSKEGKYLGDKQSLEQEIEQASGVPVQALRNAPLTDFDDQERMAWAAKRITTVEEDAAYCLLGLFDVQMPLLYGEGQQKAIERLRRKIEQSTTGGLPLMASIPWVVPFERNHKFTGREKELQLLQDRLFMRDQTSKWAITGLGGVGKTQLVIELLYRVREKHRDCTILWISALSDESLHQGCADVARKLHIPGHEDQNADVVQLVQNHLSQANSGRWLLVFDNADDLTMWTKPRISGDATTEQRRPQRLVDQLPRNKHGCIIFTTRDRKAATSLAGPNVVRLSEMDEDTAIDTLRKYLIDSDLVEDTDTAKVLVTELACLPLAIVQATAYINANGLGVAEYVKLLADKEEEVIDLLNEDFEAESRYPDVKNPVATTWLVSFEQIRERNKLAAEYLCFMACVHNKDIPQTLLPSGPSRRKEIEAISTLHAYSFVERHRVDSALNLHRLVHLATRNWLRKEEVLRACQDKTLARLIGVFPENDHQNRSLWRIYLPHALYFLGENYQAQTDEQIELMERCGRCLYSDGRWNEAERLFFQALTVRKTGLDCCESAIMKTSSWLASTYRDQGRWQEAEELLVDIVESSKRNLGTAHLNTLAGMLILTSIYLSQGRYQEAETLQVQVLEGYKSILETDHPNTLNSMHNLASTYRYQGRYQEAETLQVQVLEGYKSILGTDHPNTLNSMHNLASTYRYQGRYQEAETLQLQVLESTKSKLGTDHPDTLNSIHNLALTYRYQGRYQEAETLQLQVLESTKSKLGTAHLNTLTGMHALTATYLGQGRYQEAEILLLQVLEGYKSKLGTDHPNTLNSMHNLASTYRYQGRYQEAEILLLQVLEGYKSKLETNYPNTLKNMYTLALTYRCQGRYQEAETLQLQVLEGFKRMLGTNHPNTLKSMHNLAHTWYKMGQKDEGINLMRKVVADSAQVLGTSHPDYLLSTKALRKWEAGSSQDVDHEDPKYSTISV